uniref:Uncharacterized protein n=1 Tax=Anguilla anguilla TaxID=7936 RepID=A0A0E9V5W8_ANGAN
MRYLHSYVCIVCTCRVNNNLYVSIIKI